MTDHQPIAIKKTENKRAHPISSTQRSSIPETARSSVSPVLTLQQTAGNRAVQRMLKSGRLQAKLQIGQPNDIYEQEADRVAERVMRMPDPVVQRKCQPGKKCPLEDEKMKGSVQLKTDNPTGMIASVPDNFISSLGPGQPLDSATRAFFEPRFGQDFSGVKVHTGIQAADSAREVKARGYAIGSDVVFGAGEYAPDSFVGKQLIAHELAHVVQQNRSPMSLRRRILIAGNPYTPSVAYYLYLRLNFGSSMQEFIKRMHNNGNPPDYTFSSKEQMGYEVRIRYKAIKGIEAVHNGCCDYYSSVHPPYLNSIYWLKLGPMRFKPKSPLPAGKEASDAIEAIFAPGAGTRLECMAMTIAVEYYSMLKGIGRTKFNALFPGGAGLEISGGSLAPSRSIMAGASPKYEILAISNKNRLLPGDWVYFRNFIAYPAVHPGGYWQGENAIYLGNGKYRGFGVPAMKEDEMNQELVNKYNSGLAPADKKTLADLLAEGGGLLLNPVIRPKIANITP